MWTKQDKHCNVDWRSENQQISIFFICVCVSVCVLLSKYLLQEVHVGFSTFFSPLDF